MATYGLSNDFYTPVIFVLVGIITSFFSKNMVVILTIALVSSNVIKHGNKIRYEGMEASIDPEIKGISEKEDTIDIKDGTANVDNIKGSENENSKDIKDSTSFKDVKDVKDTKDVKNLKMVQDKYKELLVLQDKILGNVSALEDSLGSAERIVKSMSKTVSIP